MLLMILMVIMLAGCTWGQDDDNPIVTPSPTPTLAETPVSTSTENPSPSPVPTDTPQASASSPDTQTPNGQHAEGTYVGQIDNNSIEVLIDDTPTAFRLNETTQMQVSALTEGQLIGFTYEENAEGQKTIIRFDETPQTMVAVYAGQMDPHTIEVTTNGGPVAFQLTGDALTQIDSLSCRRHN